MRSIALIDDNDCFCQVMQCFLSNYFDFQGFTDTNLFLEAIRSHKYELVLVDFSITPIQQILVRNGCELIEYVKKNLEQPPLLVLFTGWLGNQPVAEGKKLCPIADGFVAKDSGIDEILHQINTLLSSRIILSDS
ncbi:MAG TPA: hypothetical protein V6C85_31085 [Allocoleopsis sp.]